MERVSFNEPPGTHFDLEGGKVLRRHAATAVELGVPCDRVSAQGKPTSGWTEITCRTCRRTQKKDRTSTDPADASD